ncbi:biotin/lipoyl-binding protein [Balneolaceae bacterium ANBcel3]|nr:biotin/lipoyl-binding protein [Balneolaceae bacterium ANBcel3]
MSKEKKIWVLAAAILVLLLFSLLMVFASRQKSSNRVVYFEGKAKLETIYVSSKVPGRVLELYAQQGEEVYAGDTLAVLDLPEVEAKRMQAQGAVRAARAQYEMALNGATSFDRRRIQAQLEAATAQYEFADSSYRRLSNMFSDSLIAAQEYEQMRASYQQAKAQLAAVEAQKEDIFAGVRTEKIEMARGDYDRAQAALREVETAWNERYIIAPVDMNIKTVVLNRGELATPGYHLFAGYQTETPRIRFTIPESQMAGFQSGNVYTLVSGFSRDPIEVTLERIVPLPDYGSITSMYPRHQLGETVYEIHFGLRDAADAEKIHHNMTFLLYDDHAG